MYRTHDDAVVGGGGGDDDGRWTRNFPGVYRLDCNVDCRICRNNDDHDGGDMDDKEEEEIDLK